MAKTKAEIETTSKSWAKAEEFADEFIQDVMRPAAKAQGEDLVQGLFGKSPDHTPKFIRDLNPSDGHPPETFDLVRDLMHRNDEDPQNQT